MVPVLRELTRGRRGDIALAVLAAVVQIGGTALAARHHPPVRTLDVYGYLLLAAGPAALLVRRAQPVPVLMLAFATTLGYVLLGYPGGPIWITLIVAFGTTLDAAGYRIVQEALTNVVRHADASGVSVRIGEEQGDLVIEVEDDGAGRPGASGGGARSGAGGGGSGIRGMTERAAALGGKLTAGRRTGSGFAVRARLPLEPR